MESGDRAQFQHVQGVCWHEGMLYVTDTLQQQDQANRASDPGRSEFHGVGGHRV